jgi:cytoskeletal protein CcmA (bactofilin family)
MQLKKSPREGRYTDSNVRYEDEQYREAAPTPPPAALAEAVELRPRPAAPPFEAEAAAPSRLQAASQPQARAESLVDAHSSFDGRYETDKDLRVEGTISGEIICGGMFTVEREASARARIQTREAQIRGRLEGDIVCSGRLLLAATAVVTGTMKAGALVVEEGATVSGSVDTSNAVAEPPARAAAGPGARGTPPTGDIVTREALRNGRRDVPNFALVSSDERNGLDHN